MWRFRKRRWSFGELFTLLIAGVVFLFIFKGVLEDVTHESAPIQKVLCVVKKTVITQTEPDGVKAIRETWGKYCTKTIFIDTHDYPYTTQGDDVLERPANLKHSGETFVWVLEQYAEDFDWVLQVEDVTYVLIPQLYHYLSTLDNRQPLFLGHRLMYPGNEKLIFNSGGAGFVLSPPAAKLLIDKSKTCMERPFLDIDIGVAKCLREKGVIASDTRTEDGKDIFHILEPLTFTATGGIYRLEELDWYHRYRKFYSPKQKTGSEFISDMSVTFHYVKADEMRALHDIWFGDTLPGEHEYFSRFLDHDKGYDLRLLLTKIKLKFNELL